MATMTKKRTRTGSDAFDEQTQGPRRTSRSASRLTGFRDVGEERSAAARNLGAARARLRLRGRRRGGLPSTARKTRLSRTPSTASTPPTGGRTRADVETTTLRRRVPVLRWRRRRRGRRHGRDRAPRRLRGLRRGPCTGCYAVGRARVGSRRTAPGLIYNQFEHPEDGTTRGLGSGACSTRAA